MHIFLLVAFGFVMPSIGIVGNGIILAVFARQKRRNVIDITLFFMAIVDLVVSCFHILKTASFKYGTNDFTCQLTIMTARAGIFASVFITIALAFYRYRAICHPFSSPISPRVGAMVSMVSIVVAMVINIPAFFIVDALPLRTGLLTCVIVDRSSWKEVAFSALSLTLFSVALFVSSVLYAMVYRAIRKQQLVRRQMVAGNAGCPQTAKGDNSKLSNSGPNSKSSDAQSESKNIPQISVSVIGLDAIPNCKETTPDDACAKSEDRHIDEDHRMNTNEDKKCVNEAQRQNVDLGKDPTGQVSTVNPGRKVNLKPHHHPHQDQEHHITRKLFIITVIFFVTWLPSIAYEYLPTGLTMSREHTLSSVTLLLVQLKLSNHFINVFVYLAVNPKFRQQTRELFCCMRSTTNTSQQA